MVLRSLVEPPTYCHPNSASFLLSLIKGRRPVAESHEHSSSSQLTPPTNLLPSAHPNAQHTT